MVAKRTFIRLWRIYPPLEDPVIGAPLNPFIDEEQIIFLNDIYIDSRYPADFGLLPSGKPNEEDARRALAIATEIDS